MSFKNNVTRILDSKRIKYVVHIYEYGVGVQSAVEVAEAVGLAQGQVFKTLVVLPDAPSRKPMLVMVPGPSTLDLRSFAKAVGLKKAKMSSHEVAEQLTGLQTGGISPLALINKGFDIYLDSRAQSLDTIAISAGQRGAQVELSVNDLIGLTRARFVDLAD